MSLAATLEFLVEERLIEIEGSPGEESVRLTGNLEG
jgi:hypothetical protein